MPDSMGQQFLKNSMASFLQIGAVLVVIIACFKIISPFINIIIWGVVISIAIYPAHRLLTKKVNNREKCSAVLFILIGLALVVIPIWVLTDSTVDGLHYLANDFADGAINISPPSENVAHWPLIGDMVFQLWNGAASNLEETLNQFKPQIKSLGKFALSLAGSTAMGIFQFVCSIILAGGLLMTAQKSYHMAMNLAKRLAGEKHGAALVDMSIGTVRSVVKGVLGVALIQTTLAAIGLLVIGVPAAGLWAGGVLVLAVAQLPPILILGPIAIWLFSTTDVISASLFLIYSLVVSVSDAFLKPLLLGRGVEVPMLVILIGAIGGAITQGLVGLFIGAVVLAVGHELLMSWIAPVNGTRPR
ncbi:AI-2E family transporter [bacterium AH-315-K03]|nr:AI-2E family transporter [bacterium AH-315-K03]